jgi:uncharacterized membrane protein YgcG
MLMATSCLATCPAGLLGTPVQLCTTSTECLNAGDSCNAFMVPGVGITIHMCQKPDAGGSSSSSSGGGEGGTDGGSSSSSGGSEGGSDAPTGG